MIDELPATSATSATSAPVLGTVVIPEGMREWSMTPDRLWLWLDVAEAWYGAQSARVDRGRWFDALVALCKTGVRSLNYVVLMLGTPPGWSKPPKLRGVDPLVAYGRWAAENMARDMAARSVRLDLSQLEMYESLLRQARDGGQLPALLGAPELASERGAEGAGAHPGLRSRAARAADAPRARTGENERATSEETEPAEPEQSARRHGWRARLARERA